MDYALRTKKYKPGLIACRVIRQFDIPGGMTGFAHTYFDDDFKRDDDALYYYIRATQLNNAIAWSGPVWVE